MGAQANEISSYQNPKIKEIAKLRTERYRKKKKRVLIDGRREISKAIRSGLEIESLFICDSEQRKENVLQLVEAIPPQRQYRLPKPLFDRIAYGDRNEGILAVGLEKNNSLHELELSDQSLILILDGIEKPGNIGAVFRTASAASIDAVLLTNSVASPFNPNAIRASLGTVFDVPFAVDSVEVVTDFLTRLQIPVLVTRVDGTTIYWDADFMNGAAIVLGSEAEGVADSWHAFPAVTIPMASSIDSLNISVSAAILAFEACRQRSQQS